MKQQYETAIFKETPKTAVSSQGYSSLLASLGCLPGLRCLLCLFIRNLACLAPSSLHVSTCLPASPAVLPWIVLPTWVLREMLRVYFIFGGGLELLRSHRHEGRTHNRLVRRLEIANH